MKHHHSLWISAAIAATFSLSSCSTTSHPEAPTNVGQALDLSAMERLLETPEKQITVELQTVESADWVAELSGLLNLDRPQAKAAQLADRAEPIKVYLHVLRHPTRGLYLIDTGFSAQMASDPGSLNVGRILKHAMHFDQIKFHSGPADAIKKNGGSLQGVFLTHTHLDHIGGLSEVPLNTPIYIGPGETSERHWTYFFTQSVVNHLLTGRPNLLSWNFGPQDAAQLTAIDIFGDASAFAISVPGHTKGSTAYLVRTPTGLVLMTGDTCHTRWGWDNSVEPGGFTRDAGRNLDSLLKLKALVARHPKISVRVGHNP
jgi:N-acyl homoserine lactone hydrolase